MRRRDVMGMSVYPVRLAKFTVKRGAANKLSICVGISRRREEDSREDSKALREIMRVCAADDARYKRSVTRSDIGTRSSFLLHSRLTFELQLRGMNSRLKAEFSSSSRNNSYPTNIARLCPREGSEGGESFLFLSFYDRDSLPVGEINAIWERPNRMR